MRFSCLLKRMRFIRFPGKLIGNHIFQTLVRPWRPHLSYVDKSLSTLMKNVRESGVVDDDNLEEAVCL